MTPALKTYPILIKHSKSSPEKIHPSLRRNILRNEMTVVGKIIFVRINNTGYLNLEQRIAQIQEWCAILIQYGDLYGNPLR